MRTGGSTRRLLAAWLLAVVATQAGVVATQETDQVTAAIASPTTLPASTSTRPTSTSSARVPTIPTPTIEFPGRSAGPAAPVVPPAVAAATGATATPTAEPTTTTTAAKPTTTTTTSATTTSTTASTTTAPPATTAPRPATQATNCCAHWTEAPYQGVGAWVDVFDWTYSFAWTKGKPTVHPEQVPAMAKAGVQTLYIQTARTNGDDDIAEQDRLQQFIDNAHAEGMDVVGWYLPTLTDMEKDMRRMLAATTLNIDGFSVDVESTEVRDEAERNRRLIDVSRRFREAIPQGTIGTVVINAFALEEIKTDVWPTFPWDQINPYYDVWQPMAYVTYRQGTEWRDTERYTAESIKAMRRHVGSEPIHVVTGEAQKMTVQDIEGFVRASLDHGATGGGIYDWSVASPGMWEAMRPLNP